MLRKSLCLLGLLLIVGGSVQADDVDQIEILRCNVFNSDGQGNKLAYTNERTYLELNNELDAGTVTVSRRQLAISFIPSGEVKRVNLNYDFRGIPKIVDGFTALNINKREVKYKGNLYLVKDGFINWSMLDCQPLEEYKDDPKNKPYPFDPDHDREVLCKRNATTDSEMRQCSRPSEQG